MTIPTLPVVILLAVVVAEAGADEAADRKEGDRPMEVMADVTPSEPDYGTSLVSCVSALLQAVGAPEWSATRLQGIMGHAFHFEMVEGGGGVFHDNIDWGIALDFLPEMARFRVFEATKKDTTVDLPALKREARDAALASLQKGIPPLVWQPMSLEQKAAGRGAYCWGLIVGYDEAQETYTIRHPFVSGDYTVRYDAIGHSDGVEWFYVGIFEKLRDVDQRMLNLPALRNAVAFAEGTRFKSKWSQGFAAYELWRQAFGSEEVSPKHSHYHAAILRDRRMNAAAYLRELLDLFPEAAGPIGEAAAHYDREVAVLKSLHDLFEAGRENDGFTAEGRAEAGRLIGEALQVEREAISGIEAALAVLEVSR